MICKVCQKITMNYWLDNYLPSTNIITMVLVIHGELPKITTCQTPSPADHHHIPIVVGL